MNMTEPLLTNEAARILGVSPETIRLWERTGRIRAALKTKQGVRLFDRTEVERVAGERAATLTTTAA